MKAANPSHWRLRQARYRLCGNACVHCGRSVFPPQPYCTRCRTGTQVTGFELSQKCITQGTMAADLRAIANALPLDQHF